MSSSYSYLGFLLVADVVVVVPLAFDQLIRQHISLFNSDNETRSFDIFFFFFLRLYGTRFRPDAKVSVKLFSILFFFPFSTL